MVFTNAEKQARYRARQVARHKLLQFYERLFDLLRERDCIDIELSMLIDFIDEARDEETQDE